MSNVGDPTFQPPAPLRGRPRSFDMETALDDAMRVFRERGYDGTSIDDLKSATGLTAGSLYKAFQNKAQLFTAAFSRYVEGRHARLSAALASAANGRERIAEVLRFYVASASGAEGRLGCLVLAALVETSTLDGPHRQALAEAVDLNRVALVKILVDGQQDRSIRSDLPVETCADLLLNLLQGLRALGKLQDPVDREAFVALALKILD